MELTDADHLLPVEYEVKCGLFPLNDLVRFVGAPVKYATGNSLVPQWPRSGWERVLEIPESPSYFRLFFPPVLLGGGSRWYVNGSTLEIFDSGVVVDGALRLEVAARLGSPSTVAALVILGIDEAEALRIRRLFRLPAHSSEDAPAGVHDPATPRLEIRDHPVEIEIDSDPFLVSTSRGYAPAMLVRRRRARQREHVLIGAKSLALPLEEIRKSRRTLCGVRVVVHKDGREKRSPYRVELAD